MTDNEEVGGSSPPRPTKPPLLRKKVSNPQGDLAQLVEHLLCKQGVRGSTPLVSTKVRPARNGGSFLFLHDTTIIGTTFDSGES